MGIMEQKMVIATFEKRDNAEALIDRLNGLGIPAIIYDESVVQRIWWFSRPRASVHVRVKKEDADRTIALMKEWAANPEDRILDAVERCPECGSTRIEYPQVTRKTLQGFFFTLLMVLHLMPKQFFCKACQFTWAAEPPEKLDLDILNWSMPKEETKEKGHIPGKRPA